MVQADGIEMHGLERAARKIAYLWPSLLDVMPESLVAASKAAIDSGRAARDMFDNVPSAFY